MKTSLLLAMLALAAGCTIIPDAYTKDPDAPELCGYKVTPAAAGFELETYSRFYSFLSAPEKAIEDARACFRRSALAVAEGRKVKPILSSNIAAAPSRNISDGFYYTVSIGLVAFED